MRTVLVAFSDTHGGHKMALMNPETILFDEDEKGNLAPYTPELTATQRWLWECYKADVSDALEFAGEDPLIVLHNGDLTWGKAHCDGLVSTRLADQMLIAVANMMPWFDYENLNMFRFAHGTASHLFEEGSSTLLVAQQLRVAFPKVNVGTVQHGLLEVDGVSFDYAHHGPNTGIRQWTEGNQLRYYLRSLMMEEILRGNQPPRVVLRSHYHTYCRETVRIHGTREWVSDIFITPAYCSLTEYSRRVTRSVHTIGCGLVAFEIVDGELLRVRPYYREVDLRREESV